MLAKLARLNRSVRPTADGRANGVAGEPRWLRPPAAAEPADGTDGPAGHGSPTTPFGKATVNSTDRADHPDVIALPPIIFLGCAVLGSLLQFIFPIRVMRYTVTLPLGVVLAVVSASLAIWAARVMKAGKWVSGT